MDKRLKEAIHRHALWKAYNRKCIYCGNFIPTVYQLEEEHIIPQIYRNKPKELEKIIKEYELWEDFDIDAYYNRVPTDKGCNNRKSFNLHRKESIHYYLNIAEGNVKKIEEIEKKLEKKVLANDDLFKKGFGKESLEKFLSLMKEGNIVSEIGPLSSLNLGVFFDDEGKKQTIELSTKIEKATVFDKKMREERDILFYHEQKEWIEKEYASIDKKNSEYHRYRQITFFLFNRNDFTCNDIDLTIKTTLDEGFKIRHEKQIHQPVLPTIPLLRRRFERKMRRAISGHRQQNKNKTKTFYFMMERIIKKEILKPFSKFFNIRNSKEKQI